MATGIGTQRIGTQSIAGAPQALTNQTVTLPSLGDVATIGGVTVEPGPYTLPLATLGDVATINGPNVFIYEPLSLPSIGGGPVAGGLWIATAPEPDPTPTPGEPIARSDTPPARRIVVRVCDPDDPLTVLATLDEARRERWQKVLSQHGTGSCVLQNDDADLVATNYGRLLRFELDGRATFLSVIEGKDQVVVSQQEDVAEATEVGGRGVLAQWDDLVVYPEAGATGRPFSDQRLLNWTSADFDDSGWSVVKVGQRIGDVHAVDPNIAKGFPDADAHVLWAWGSGETGTPGGGGIEPGIALLRSGTVTVGTAGWFRFFVSADDGATIIIDGVQLYQEARLWFHLETQYVDVYLSAGDHQVAMRVENLDNGNLAGNSAWGLMSAMAITEDGELGAVLVRTDSSWVGVAYPPKPPGFTVGRAIRVLLEEAQARGAMVGWSLAFTDNADSAGQAWADDPELAFQCGLDGYSVLQELAEAYVELDVAPAQKVLYAYADGYGQDSGVTFAEAASILALAHQGTA
jgi:hypothetical protein